MIDMARRVERPKVVAFPSQEGGRSYVHLDRQREKERIWLRAFRSNAHDRAMRESTFSRAQVLKYAQIVGPSFKARWRLEGSAAGNSKLVTLAAARKLQDRYGGTIVEMLPPGWIKTRVDVQRAAGLPYCPMCRVDPDAACRDRLGNLRPPHDARIALANVQAMTDEELAAARPRMSIRDRTLALALDTCPVCGVAPYRVCRSPRGRPRLPHHARPRLVPQENDDAPKNT